MPETLHTDLENGNGVNINQNAQPTREENRSEVKEIKRRMKEVTVEGFRSLSFVSVFIAAVEAQCLGLTEGADINDRAVQAINCLLLVGMLFSTFGAVLSLLVGRWFELLIRDDELRLLDYRWELARSITSIPEILREEKERNFHLPVQGRPSINGQIESCHNHKRNKVVAWAVFVPLKMIALGFFSFVAGIIVYTWKFQSYPTAAICTAASTIGFGLIICMHLDYESMGALNQMDFERFRI